MDKYNKYITENKYEIPENMKEEFMKIEGFMPDYSSFIVNQKDNKVYRFGKVNDLDVIVNTELHG